MLLVHGSASSGRMWRRIGSLLPGPHTAPDLTRTGTSPEAVFEADLAVLEAALEQLDGPVTIGAHSYGGFLALHLARRHPDRIARVFAHEPVCWQALAVLDAQETYDRFEAQLDAGGLNLRRDPGSPTWMRTFIEFWNGPRGWLGLPESAQQALVAAGPKTAAEVLMVFKDRSLAEDIGAVRCPVRITVGQGAQPAERQVVELLAEALPDGALAEVEGAHLAPITHPQQVAEAWGRWL